MILSPPSLAEFRERARHGNLVPVTTELLADTETPVSLYRRLAEGTRFSFLLESVERGEHLGRYSFLGADPRVIFKARGAEQEIIAEGDERDFRTQETPLATLRHLMDHYRPVRDPKLPPFAGGAVGYLSYDMVRHFERLPDRLPDELGLPDALFMIADTLVAFDHVRHRILLIANALIEGGQVERAWKLAVERLEALEARLSRPQTQPPRLLPASPLTGGGELPAGARSNQTREQFETAVRRAKEYIAAGDIFQVVLSQRLSVPFTCPPFDIYRTLRAINPSPYMFYLSCGDLAIAGSSPEILVRAQAGTITVRPIAGTRPRGATEEIDQLMERELINDPKERAEHVMLVDLGRNDVGRVSTPGSVRVSDFMTVERYSHVMHLVSNVTGTIAPDKDAFDALAAGFPAGTVTGAPKIRAMEVIEELEPVRRGPYAGSVVYFGFNGSMDSCITLRTAVLKNQTAHVQAGAGIVADSDPAAEWQETLNKARALMKAIEMAEAGAGGPKGA